jgi:hypothetical protein
MGIVHALVCLFLAHFWFPLLGACLAGIIWLGARLRHPKMTPKQAFDLSGSFLAGALVFGLITLYAIGVPVTFIAIVIATFNLSGSPLIAAIPKWHGLPVFIWLMGGLGILFLISTINSWLYNRWKTRTSQCRHIDNAVRHDLRGATDKLP